METTESIAPFPNTINPTECNSDTEVISPTGTSSSGQEQAGAIRKYPISTNDGDNYSNVHSPGNKSPCQRKSRIGDGGSDPDSDWNKSNQRWMKLRTTVQISSAIQKKPPLKREDSFLKRFSTRQIPETQETVEDTGSDSASGDADRSAKRRRRYLQKRRSVVNPDENFYFYWLMLLTVCVLYNLWALIVRESFPELQKIVPIYWFICDVFTDIVFIFDIIVQLRTGYLEQGLMVYDDKKLACHYTHSRDFVFDVITLIPLDLLQLKMGTHPLLRFTRFFKVYRSVKFYYIVESRTVWPNLWRVVNLIHILLILAHWFGCFYYLLSEAEGFQGDWVYPYRPGDYATLTRKYLGSLYWSTLTLTTIGDLPTPETNAEYIFTIVSYLIGVFIFATIVGQVGNVITNRNANRLEFERLLDGAKTYMRHHKVPGGMKRRVLRWYDYSWSRGRIQGGGDINTALGLLPDKLKTELALHVNLSVLKKVTIFQECQPEFLHDLVLKMKAYIFTPGDSICRKGEVAREMFIIADGILEVLSETGKVLTTMKAGDFFGEIGILNLDGLNKRTADVRSVGYSELFSLSREDVLAAMKDYPEAQEILQTLGRKRLMEVRCVNKKYAKAQSEKEAASYQAQHGHVLQTVSSEMKMVEKLRNDVKGLRNVLKKSRTSRRSDESLEMQPLHNSSPKSVKTVLKRMSRVRSDEKEEATERKDDQFDKTPSPIGAGLPLLERLRLLKEKQDREERTVKPSPPQKSPTHSHVTLTCTLSPQESIREEPERELNEGLPLIQRLQHLKMKNESLTTGAKSMVSDTDAVASKVETACSKSSNKGSDNHDNGTTSLTVADIKPIIKVSFKQRIQKLQSVAETICPSNNSRKVDGNISSTVKRNPPKTLLVPKKANEKEEAKAPKLIPAMSNNIAKPSIKTSSVASDLDADAPIKPWSKLKLATLISSSYTSLTSYSEDINSPLKNFSVENIPNTMTEEIESASSYLHCASFRSGACTPNAVLKPPSKNKMGNRTKFYQSVFDLSPEYNGLPFVKRLKILNERQKLAELEKVLQTRSFSLDSSKASNGVPISESLYRCYSDTSGIYSQFLSTYESSSTTSTNTSTSESSKKNANILESVKHDYSPLSPESNETLERRKLKSILKKLHKSRELCESTGYQENHNNARMQSKGLLREPTLEGPPDSAKPYDQGHAHSHENELNPFETESIEIDERATHSTPSSGARSINLPENFVPENFVPKKNSAMQTGISKNPIAHNSTLVFPIHSESYLHSDNPTSSSTGKFPKFEGVPEAQEYFNQIICGINNVIKTHMNEMHLKFESHFSSMACEVKKRDAVIAHLEMKLKKLEFKSSSSSLSRRKANLEALNKFSNPRSEGNSSSESSAELLFMRGDSLDTVFTSSPPIQMERSSNSPSTSKYTSESSTYKTGKNLNLFGKSRRDSEAVMVSDTNSNFKKFPGSVILDIGESSSSSSSDHKLRFGDDNDEYNKKQAVTDELPHVHHNDWEVRMLAAEMEKQERKRGHSLSVNLGDIEQCGSFLRRRRKFSETETEYSETDAEEMPVPTRPRASSLDQFNLRYGIGSGIFKTMSSDRNNDKL